VSTRSLLFLLFFCSCSALSACAKVRQLSDSDLRLGAKTPAGLLDFSWRLTGDRKLGPIQVFSDRDRTWVQWATGQVIPVITSVQAEGEAVLPYTRQTPYTILDGHWPELSFRLGQRFAHAKYVGKNSKTQQPQQIAQATVERATLPNPSVQSSTIAESPLQTSSVPLPPAQIPTPKLASLVYSVTPDDLHLRNALKRWSGISGWTFHAEHWSVDVDIPLLASASFTDDFRHSVQQLVATTELSERPLQPCFYSNQVLRIVALSQACDQTAGASTIL
jgi:hypothetical protein